MASTHQQVRDWVMRAARSQATHLLIICDTYDHEDFPVAVGQTENVREVMAHYQDGHNTLEIMEVYNLSMDLDAQLHPATRAWNP